MRNSKMMLMMGMLAAIGDGMNLSSNHIPEESKTKKDIDKAYQHNLNKRGVREFIIDGISVMAINKKNAERKAAKIKAKL